MDPLDILGGLGVTVAWAQTMAWSVVYVAEQRVVVLNADCPRDELAEALFEVLPELLQPAA